MVRKLITLSISEPLYLELGIPRDDFAEYPIIVDRTYFPGF